MPADINYLKVTTKNTLHEIAMQSRKLATGLQNIAPPPEQAKPANSILYLMEVSELLETAVHTIEEFDGNI